MNTESNPRFEDLSFLEKKAMLDFAEDQVKEFTGYVINPKDEEKESGITESFRDRVNYWTGIRNALIQECEMHVQRALGEDFHSSQHQRR